MLASDSIYSQDDPELQILRPLPPMCWDYRSVPSCLGCVLLGNEHNQCSHTLTLCSGVTVVDSVGYLVGKHLEK